MSLLTALSSGTTGLESASVELAVVGDNIANANTIGFKGGRAAFEDALSQTIIGGGGGIGLGARLASVQKILSQGALATTGIATDLALQGNGYFAVRGNHNGQQGTFFTRAGQFTIDPDGYLVSLEGLRVQGFPADPAGIVSGVPGDLLVGNASALPRPTSSISVKANLQADAANAPAWLATNPAGTSTFSTSVSVYDSLGTAHAVQIFFRKNGPGDWEWHAMTDGAGLAPPAVAGQLTDIASGSLTFDSQGRLETVTQSSSFNPLGATNPQPLTFNFGDPTGVGGALGGTGLSGVSQFAAPSTTTFIGQDGFGSGQLASIRIDSQGVVAGVFSNGQQRVLGQVGIAAFAAPDKLERSGGNLYQQTPGSGQPALGTAGAGGRGSIASGALEQSNVDLAEQFVRLIAAQRAFQANSKTITTADQLLAELIAMKR